jgi:predicted PurR-regulated permease PerM
MAKNSFKLQNTAYTLVILTLSVFILIRGKVVISPIIFSIFLALMLKPICSFLENKMKRRWLAIIVTYIIAVIPLSLAILFFSSQSISIFKQLPSVEDRLTNTFTNVFEWLGNKLNLNNEDATNWASENISSILDVPLSFLGQGIESTTIVLANMVLIVVITYFLLLYRTAFKQFFLVQIQPNNREKVENLFDKIQHIAQNYLLGLGTIILILGVLIGTGLWLIGVPFAFFWGFLAAFLGIIPYIGTAIGGILPFLYMLAFSTNLWQPFAVLALYLFVQQIEGNLITPNIMGSSIQINPLVAIFGLFVGGVMWGIAGMILALPLIAVVKEILRSFDSTISLSYLMENKLSKNAGIFKKRFDNDRFRIRSLFVSKEQNETKSNDGLKNLNRKSNNEE